ncbi:MAG TPA: hypothetical protein DCQ64_13715 [Candidatus Rokubacteria bacterium]|nr:hypothetical protein [Candidatus Rokubacteria bacterium]
MEIDYEQLQDMLDLKKVEVLGELMARLQREMAAWSLLSQQIAWAKSREVTDQLALTVPEASPGTADNGHEHAAVKALELQRRKVMEAMRASLYQATNRMKQYTQQGKDAYDRQVRSAVSTPALVET